MKAPQILAQFDSAATMVRATARFLHGKSFPALGLGRHVEPLARASARLPWRWRERVSILGGWAEAVRPSRLRGCSVEPIYAWASGSYPRRPYPAVVVGSPNGAAVHLCAALGIPLLPQTFLVLVREAVDPDDATAAMKLGRESGRWLLEANPDIGLHHMHDASQDRLMVRAATYFRVKRRRLGPSYERFLSRSLPRGGTIILSECRRSWPTTRMADRYVFQHGAVGGATEAEFLHGGPRVRDYLRRYGSGREAWSSPEPDGRSPEAEWGFDPALLEDVERFARVHGYRVQRLVYEDPNDLSPFVAELHRWWYRRRGMPASRLLVGSFFILEPWWTLRTGSVPFWLTFNMEPDLADLERYLEETDPYDELFLMLFNHGTVGVGLPRIDDWRRLFERAGRGAFVGQNEQRFPLDHASYARYHTDLKASIPARYPVGATQLTLEEVDAFSREHRDRFAVRRDPVARDDVRQ